MPPVPCASLMMRSATWICGPTRNAVSGRTTPSDERARDRERLEGGAGLVGEADRAVDARPRGRLLDLVGVDARPVRHRQQVAGVRVHHDRGRALGLVGAPHPGQHLLGAVLEREVERQAQVLARRGRPSARPARPGVPRASFTIRCSPSAPRSSSSSCCSSPDRPDVVDAHRPDHLRRLLALGVVAARVVEHADALDLQPLDLRALARP